MTLEKALMQRNREMPCMNAPVSCLWRDLTEVHSTSSFQNPQRNTQLPMVTIYPSFHMLLTLFPSLFPSPLSLILAFWDNLPSELFSALLLAPPIAELKRVHLGSQDEFLK